jgi:hypothetical protein
MRSHKVSRCSPFLFGRRQRISTVHRRVLFSLISHHVTDCITGGAAFCLASILLEGDKLEKESRLVSPISAVLESFVSWMTARLQSSTMRSLSVVTPSLTVLLVSRGAREIFDKAGGIGYLARHLRVRKAQSDTRQTGAGASVQQLYELCYCLWLLSFDCTDSQDIRNHFHRDGAVLALVDLVAAAPREKIVRLALSTLRNLAVCKAAELVGSSAKRAMTGSVFLIEMIGCGLLKWIDLMKERQWKDPDLIEGKTPRQNARARSWTRLTNAFDRLGYYPQTFACDLSGNDAVGRIQSRGRVFPLEVGNRPR